MNSPYLSLRDDNLVLPPMPFLYRFAEALEGASRLISTRGSRIAALEKFYAARTEDEPPSRAGILEGGFGNPAPGLVSIIILTLNGAAMLETLFRSIRRYNSWDQLEFLVVDHGGDDETREVLVQASKDFNIRHLVPGRNFSFSFSCNRAAQIARGETLLFLNNDIELTEDALPAMMAAVQATGGVVGLKIRQKSPEGAIGGEPQIGVRFRWNLQQGWTVPYEAHPRRSDALRATHPSRMPVVTAAMVACARDRFLELGGFSEIYLYAYEDVDFCLKAAAAGMPSISLNDISAAHLSGATRIRRARFSRRRRWHGYNRSVFRARCGYRVRRLAWSGLFGGEGFDWGRRPAVALLRAPGDGGAASAASMPSPFAFVEEVREGLFGYGLYGYDLVVSRNPSAILSHARHLSPMAVTVGWADRPEGWERTAHDYDLLVAPTPELAAGLSARTGRPVDVLPDGDWQQTLMRLVERFLRERHRVVLAGGEGGEETRRLASALRRRGFAVRQEPAASYPSARAMRDDFAIWMERPAAAASLPPDTCHISLFDPAGDDEWCGDIRIGDTKMRFEDRLELLVAEMEGYHAERMAGPADAPLARVDLPDVSEASAFWNGYEDPTAWLIEQP